MGVVRGVQEGGGVRKRFVPKRGILAACLEAVANVRRERIAAIRRRHADRLWTAGHQRLDNALWAAEKGATAQTGARTC